jgi:hypothetical protein
MSDRKLWFVHFAQWVSHVTGRPIAFLLAVTSIVVWGLTGPLFGYSDTWQLVINTATTIVTFLMVFVIQNTQNRDTAAIHIKIDELIPGDTEGAQRPARSRGGRRCNARATEAGLRAAGPQGKIPHEHADPRRGGAGQAGAVRFREAQAAR